jgi:hypothetical protein
VSPDAGKSCTQDGDCAANRSYTHGVCNVDGKCASTPSCRAEDGGYTCGPTKDQDCCASPIVPGQAVSIDAYKVTAGRVREFVTAVDGDVNGWYLANRTRLPAATSAQLDPYLDATTGRTQGVVLPSDLHSYPWGVDYQLGGTIYTGNHPSDLTGCYVGAHDSESYGAHTYDNGSAEGDERGYSTQYLDRLPINCITYVMAAAFCAWDGGRLSTSSEHEAIGATGLGSAYVWGDAPEAGGWARDDDQTIVGPAFPAGFLGSTNPCPSCSVQMVNWQLAYEHVRFDPNDDSNPVFLPALINGVPPRDVPVNYDYATTDLTYDISPPGRFPYDSFPRGMDLSTKTHYDVMGLMFEMHGEATHQHASGITPASSLYCSQDSDCVTQSCDTSKNVCIGTQTQPAANWLGGSWEGHALDTFTTQPVMTKYGKATMRCARD